MSEGSSDIRFDRRGQLGVVTLDRQSALNALSHAMVRQLSAQLAAWRHDPGIAAVLVRPAPGRAFCAGGDVRVMAELVRDHGAEAGAPYFQDEYRLNWRVNRFPKPYVAFLDGITMGGGVGIAVHGAFRVVTENTLLAMPETGIGFFPDVGATWFLPRCPGEVGTWLGLTGARLKSADLLAAGLGTHAVPAARLDAVEAALADRLGTGEAGATVAACLAEAAGPIGEPVLPTLRARIDGLFAGKDVTAIVERLGNEPTGFGAEQLAALSGKSPLAVHVALAQLRRGRGLPIEDCLALEYRMVHRILAVDFVEGVRALIVDKDRRPRWRHASLAAVGADEVAAVFAPLPGGDLGFDWQVG